MGAHRDMEAQGKIAHEILIGLAQQGLPMGKPKMNSFQEKVKKVCDVFGIKTQIGSDSKDLILIDENDIDRYEIWPMDTFLDANALLWLYSKRPNKEIRIEDNSVFVDGICEFEATPVVGLGSDEDMFFTCLEYLVILNIKKDLPRWAEAPEVGMLIRNKSSGFTYQYYRGSKSGFWVDEYSNKTLVHHKSIVKDFKDWEFSGWIK